MKRNLLTVIAIGAIAAGGFAWAQGGPGGPHGGGGPGGWHGHEGGPLDHLTETLNLTPDQKTKVQPIIDQAKPQMKAIHEEAMQKAKAVMDATTAQIRPILTPEQQARLDEVQKAHQDMHNAMKEMHDAQSK
jgi:Spy/CpxP family protein refolding chaperone